MAGRAEGLLTVDCWLRVFSFLTRTADVARARRACALFDLCARAGPRRLEGRCGTAFLQRVWEVNKAVVFSGVVRRDGPPPPPVDWEALSYVSDDCAECAAYLRRAAMDGRPFAHWRGAARCCYFARDTLCTADTALAYQISAARPATFLLKQGGDPHSGYAVAGTSLEQRRKAPLTHLLVPKGKNAEDELTMDLSLARKGLLPRIEEIAVEAALDALIADYVSLGRVAKACRLRVLRVRDAAVWRDPGFAYQLQDFFYWFPSLSVRLEVGEGEEGEARARLADGVLSPAEAAQVAVEVARLPPSPFRRCYVERRPKRS